MLILFFILFLALCLKVLCSVCPAPTIDYSVSFSTNGDFQTPRIPNGTNNLEGPNIKIPGWDSDIMQLGRAEKFNPFWPPSPNQVIEMDTTKNQNYTKVQILEKGKYLLTFEHAARDSKPVESSGLRVYWNSVIIFDVIATDKLLHQQNIFIDAVEGENVLILEGTGTNDKYGMSIDNVNIYQVNDYNRQVSNDSTTCQCKYGYFQDGVNIVCIPCQSVSAGCQDCQYTVINSTNSTNASVDMSLFECTVCSNGTIPVGSSCYTCQDLNIGCIDCGIHNGSFQCYQCNTTQQYFLEDVNISSLPNSTYYENTSQLCYPCDIVQCISCSSAETCLVCNTSNNYFMDAQMQCQQCQLLECLLCGTLNACLQCNQSASYFLNDTSDVCEPCTIAYCLQCSSLTECVSCDTNASYYLNPNSTSAEQCLYCNNSQKMLIDETLNCVQCLLLGCIECSSLETCSLCNQTHDYFLIQNQTCQPCTLQGCLDCFSLYECSVCDSANGYGFDNSNITHDVCGLCNTSCSCDGYGQPWHVDEQRCSSECGDGYIVLDQFCDDGNIDSHDGCSSACQIQQYFACIGEPSNCSFVGQISGEFLNATRTGCNSLDIFIQLVPDLLFFANYELQQLIFIQHQNISEEHNVKYVDGLFEIKAVYTGDISQGRIKVSFTPTVYHFLSNATDSLIQFEYEPLLPPVYYNEQECASMEKVETLLQVVQGVSYGVLFLSILNCKIIGLQLFGVLQLAYFDLSNHLALNRYLYPLRSFKTFNGYNIQINQSSQTNQMPQRIKQMGLSTLYANNINIMFLGMIAVFVIGTLIYLIGKISKSQTIQTIALYILKQGGVTLVLFNLYNMSFSMGLHWEYTDDHDIYSILSQVSIYISLLIAIATAVCMQITDEVHYGEFKDKFKNDCISKVYIPLTIFYRIAVGIYISIENEYEQGTLIVIFITFSFIIFNLANLPFRNAAYNYRANIIHITQIYTLYTANYYRSMRSATPMPQKARIVTPALIQLILIVACVAISLVMVLYQFYLFVQGKCYPYKRKIKPTQKISSQQENSRQNVLFTE